MKPSRRQRATTEAGGAQGATNAAFERSVELGSRLNRALRRRQGPSRHLSLLAAFPLRYSQYLVSRGLGFRAERSVRFFTEDEVTLDIRDYDAQILFLTGVLHEVEFPLLRWMLASLTPEDCFVDIGANCGLISAVAASRCGLVVAIEPNTQLASRLLRLAERHPNLTVVETALGAKDHDSVELFIPIGHSGAGSILKDRNPGSRSITVPSERLDSLLGRIGAVPTVVKLDVEGAEELVLQGAESCLGIDGLTLILEYHGTLRPEGEHKASLRALEAAANAGLALHVIGPDGKVEAGTLDDLEAQAAKFGYTNALCRRLPG